jgi:hypothetical protein
VEKEKRDSERLNKGRWRECERRRKIKSWKGSKG